MMANLVAGVLLLAVAVYAVSGGADFGSGFWDLVAGGARRGARPRAAIEHAIGPVWEGNHVWLIFIFVVLWTAFPTAYASITLTLFVPLTIAALGIVLRGSGFALRKAIVQTRYRRIAGAAFAFPSVFVPFCLGAVIGAVASGRVPDGGIAGDPWESWLNPTAISVGVLAVATTVAVAAIYLVFDASRTADDEMVAYFRTRALVSTFIAGVVGLAAMVVMRSDARYVYDGLTSRAAPIVLVSIVCGAGAIALLTRRMSHRGARTLAILGVVSLVVAWGIAQWDYVLPETLTIEMAAAPSGTLTALVIATVGLVILVLPAFFLLYRLDQRGLLPEEGVADEA